MYRTQSKDSQLDTLLNQTMGTTMNEQPVAQSQVRRGDQRFKLPTDCMSQGGSSSHVAEPQSQPDREDAVLIENVKGLLTKKLSAYGVAIVVELESQGYEMEYRLAEALGYGGPQVRPRFVMVALKLVAPKPAICAHSVGRKHAARK